MSVARKILIVDDDAALRHALAEQLQLHEEFEALEAETAGAALELVKQHLFDAILLDISMPGMGGVAACQQLRMRADYRDCLIIACTAHAGRVELASYAESGFSNTLTKPFLVQQLFAVLQLPHPFA